MDFHIPTGIAADLKELDEFISTIAVIVLQKAQKKSKGEEWQVICLVL